MNHLVAGLPTGKYLYHKKFQFPQKREQWGLDNMIIRLFMQGFCMRLKDATLILISHFLHFSFLIRYLKVLSLFFQRFSFVFFSILQFLTKIDICFTIFF